MDKRTGKKKKKKIIKPEVQETAVLEQKRPEPLPKQKIKPHK